MKTTYDKEADAVYIYLKSLKSQLESGEGALIRDHYPFIIDLNSKCELLGIEVLEASTIFNQEFLDACEQL